MPMVWTQRQARAAFAFTSALFSHQGTDDSDHVDMGVFGGGRDAWQAEQYPRCSRNLASSMSA
ncbi:MULTISPECIES: hypothetical protein [unclassified Pseudomonas]|uniref:hypothetical protein n=1 Tax=unclassified Pseudomonas TaxID=196821 RepID=UPI0008716BE9|nr:MULTISPECIES: hypothetical protein [unclassified Pseudomonas]SCW29970.1 hypothetical protein SAMN03159481_00249 [Pseudomonas sp. NFACC56-3]SFK11844.1 hypothetical protein SAMN03159473_00248 [Pseudomonas sp. NFACC52]